MLIFEKLPLFPPLEFAAAATGLHLRNLSGLRLRCRQCGSCRRARTAQILKNKLKEELVYKN